VSETAQVLALAHEDLACYGIAQWPQFKLAKHHELIVGKLETVERGQIKRLIILLPPRYGKSLITSAIFPAWYLGRHPDHQVIFTTYAQELSDDFGRRVRNFIADLLHRAIFPNCVLSEDSAAAHRFNTTRGGAYYAVGTGGPITGRGTNLLIIDDPIKDREEANSETRRKALHDWFASVAYTRLMPNAAIVLIQTRWHEDDLAGWLLREHASEQWDVLSLPAIAERDEGFRREGEALWPEQFPMERLKQIRETIGGAAWASLYQQRPAAAEGAIFKRGWWQFYREPPKCSRIVQSWDTAFKRGAENDYSVCTTWGAADNGYYLLHLWRDRVEFPDLKRAFASLAGQWNPEAILVEDRASGQSLIQELKATALPVIAVRPDSDKLARAQAVTPLVEAGKVFLPESMPSTADLIDELACFPAGRHDDIVDSLAQALNYLRKQSTTQFFEPRSSAEFVDDEEELEEKMMRGETLTWQEFERFGENKREPQKRVVRPAFGAPV
jgi:predicted phage terminase large subunit-like protein